MNQLKPTLPLIRMLAQLNAADRATVVAMLTSTAADRREKLEPWLARTDGLRYSRDKALSYARAAQADLAVLPESPARDALHRLAESVVRREA